MTDGIVRCTVPPPRRRFMRRADGLIRLDQHTCCRETGIGLDVTGPYWIFALVRLRRGNVAYLRGEMTVTAPDHAYGVFLPPFSVVQCRLHATCADSRAVASGATPAADLPAHPVAFPTSLARVPSSVRRIEEAIRAGRPHVPIGRDHLPRPLSRQVKALIDARYDSLPPLAVVARQLRTSPAVMSRGFAGDYGISPVRYRHAIRVMDAMMRLIAGEPICEVAGAVGFNDLGQFYRRFGALAGAPPGAYRRLAIEVTASAS
jgi:AraC-like DNA-binding protein